MNFKQMITDKEFKEVPLSELTSTIIDCSHAKKPLLFSQGEYVFLEVNNITDDGNVDLTDVKYVTKEDYEAWTKRIIPQGKDLVITKTGRVGAAGFIPDGLKCCIGRNIVLIRPDKEKIVPEYLLYYFLSHFFRKEIEKLSLSGTVLDSLHVKYIPNLKIRYFSLERQRKIVDILNPIFSKILLNNEINANLETISRTLFRHWFGDFQYPDDKERPYKSSGGVINKS